MRKFIAIAGLVFISLIVNPATASEDVTKAIIAYNQAKSSGDLSLRLEAAKVLGEAAIANPDCDDAPVLAFEAAQTLCLAGDCESAQPFADWLATQTDSSLPTGDIGLLQAYANWQVKKNSRTREPFDAALITFGTDPSLLSVAAYQARYMHDLEKARWRRAAETAQAAADHFEPILTMIPSQWADAEIAVISSRFNAEPDEQDLYDMVRLRWDFSRREQLDQNRDAMDSARYRAQAWQLAMDAYFASRFPNSARDERITTTVREILDRSLPQRVRPQAIEFAEGSIPTLPFCSGQFVAPKPLKYPNIAINNGWVGAVIIKFDVEDGHPINLESLAAVPFEGFSETVLDYAASRTYEVKSGEPGINCQLSRKSVIEPYIFNFRR